MHLLISDINVVDAALDRAIPWTDDLADALTLQPPDIESPPDIASRDGDEPEIVGRKHPWYEPRLSALRRLIAEQQSWETR